MPIEKQTAAENPVPGRRALGLLLSQLGTHAALSFGRKIASLGISASCGGSMPTEGRISANSPRISESCPAAWLCCSMN